MASKFLTMAALLVPLCFPEDGHAYCFDSGSERLGSYCAISEIDGAVVDLGTARALDGILKNQGYRQGLGLTGGATNRLLYTSISPSIWYSNDVNGGNPPGPLVLGNLAFKGDADLFRKAGIMTALGLSIGGRYIYGEGRYFDYSLRTSYSHSPKFNIGIFSTSANVCSLNHIENWYYLDLCANTTNTKKDLSDERVTNINIIVSKIFETYGGTYSKIDFGINRYMSDTLIQNQLSMGFDSIYSNGLFTEIDLRFGESVNEQLASRFDLSTSIGMNFYGSPLALSTRYDAARGGSLLGFDRNDETYKIELSYPLSQYFTASAGYIYTNSTIDYFDTRYPIFSVNFVGINF